MELRREKSINANSDYIDQAIGGLKNSCWKDGKSVGWSSRESLWWAGEGMLGELFQEKMKMRKIHKLLSIA